MSAVARRRVIDRIVFLFHPACWAMSDAPDPEYLETYGVRRSWWYAARNRERRVVALQKEFIAAMRPGELLYLHPIGDSGLMRDLKRHALDTLGDRCLVERGAVITEPAGLDGVPEPIRHVLHDPDHEGCAAYWTSIPAEHRAPIRSEIEAACARDGYAWGTGALKVIANSYLYARFLETEMAARGFTCDPHTVTAVAFGEGFEQCAMTWKAMIPPILGWRHPVENDYDLSVSGAPVLGGARFVERLALDHDVRLFLWELPNALQLGFYARARCRLADPHYAAHVDPDGEVLELRDIRDRVLVPGRDAALTEPDGRLAVPVLSGVRKYREDDCYVVGCSTCYDRFPRSAGRRRRARARAAAGERERPVRFAPSRSVRVAPPDIHCAHGHHHSAHDRRRLGLALRQRRLDRRRRRRADDSSRPGGRRDRSPAGRALRVRPQPRPAGLPGQLRLPAARSQRHRHHPARPRRVPLLPRALSQLRPGVARAALLGGAVENGRRRLPGADPAADAPARAEHERHPDALRDHAAGRPLQCARRRLRPLRGTRRHVRRPRRRRRLPVRKGRDRQRPRRRGGPRRRSGAADSSTPPTGGTRCRPDPGTGSSRPTSSVSATASC